MEVCKILINKEEIFLIRRKQDRYIRKTDSKEGEAAGTIVPMALRRVEFASFGTESLFLSFVLALRPFESVSYRALLPFLTVGFILRRCRLVSAKIPSPFPLVGLALPPFLEVSA